MASLIFDEGDAIAAPAKTPRHHGLASTRKALGDASARPKALDAGAPTPGAAAGLPTPATRKNQPTTAKRVLFGDITRGAANGAATVRRDAARPPADGTAKTPGRKITFQTPARTGRKIAFADEDETKDDAATKPKDPEATGVPALTRRQGGYRDDTEPIEKPLGNPFNHDELLATLARIDAANDPTPDFDDDFAPARDPVEETLRAAGEEFIDEERDNRLARMQARAEADYAALGGGLSEAPDWDPMEDDLPDFGVVLGGSEHCELGPAICEPELCAKPGEVPAFLLSLIEAEERDEMAANAAGA